MSEGLIDAEERARLREGISASKLSQSSAALDALRADCACRGSERTVACEHLRSIYTDRLEHLRRYDTVHPKQLANSVEEFLRNLERAGRAQAVCYEIETPVEFKIIVFVSAEKRDVLGCLKTVSKIAVSPERWREIWGDGGHENSGEDPTAG